MIELSQRMKKYNVPVYYTLAVVFLAVLATILPPLTNSSAFSTWIYRAFVLLVIASPFSFVLSSTACINSGIAKALKKDISIKDHRHLELLNKVNVVVLDVSSISSKGIYDYTSKIITDLRELGDMRIAMLTGDGEHSARSKARELKIEEFYYNLLPHQKALKLKEIKESSFDPHILFAGNITDVTPVLSRSDISVAVRGLSSDAEIEAADILLMTKEAYKLVDALKISKKVKAVLWQNTFLSLGIKLLLIVPVVLGIAAIREAVLAEVGVTILTVLNALRVMRGS
jgi:Cd2+/Zn2+-exporting ATPase